MTWVWLRSESPGAAVLRRPLLPHLPSSPPGTAGLRCRSSRRPCTHVSVVSEWVDVDLVVRGAADITLSHQSQLRNGLRLRRHLCLSLDVRILAPPQRLQQLAFLALPHPARRGCLAISRSRLRCLALSTCTPSPTLRRLVRPHSSRFYVSLSTRQDCRSQVCGIVQIVEWRGNC